MSSQCQASACTNTIAQPATGRTRQFCCRDCRVRAFRGRVASTPAPGKTNAPDAVSAKSASFVTRKINGLAGPVYRGSGIIGPASVIQVELIDGRQWDEVASEGGVVSYVSRITKPVLRGP
jgi:hypothetical protein